MEKTAILQLIGSSDKGKQPALAPREHSNTWTPISLNIISNTPPINRIMAYQDIAKLEKFSGEEDNAYFWIVDAKKAITANAIKRDYYTMVQVLNQFIKGLQNNILRSVRPRHPTSLQDAITLAHDFESAKQKVNHTQAVNLAINGTSDPELQELTNHPNEEKITTTADTHSNRTISNSNNLGDLIPTTATTVRNLDTLPVTAEGRSWTKIKETHTSNPDISKTCLMEDQSFDKSTSVEERNIEQISQPSKQTKSNIPPVTITEDTTLAAIFPFDIDNLNTHSLFSGAAINQNKPIMALYTDARVGKIDIKLILDSGSAADENTKTLIGKIDNFPFEINGIQIPTKVLIMEATQYQALVGNDWLSKANATLD
ncbi:hypothetical protein G9A89_016683 [Geosiphon pyriformis]|nr:hypothetical protein G9A89_016683 [Geosiphon pyriformis]